MNKSNKKIPLMLPFLEAEEMEAVIRPLQSGWVTQGPEVLAFENEFANYVGSKYACATSNCTSALHMALLAIGVKKGDEVITVSHSFIATANCIHYCNATPVFIDIELDSYNIDISQITDAINERTKAILCVHQMGRPCNIEGLLKIAQKHNIPVVEDAACAIGSEVKVGSHWKKIGSPQGEIVCFSFHPRKILTTGDGGMITTNNENYDKYFRLLRQHGMSISDIERHKLKQVNRESYKLIGFNYRLTDIQASIGRAQLKKLPIIIANRRRLAERYMELLSQNKHIKLPSENNWLKSNFQSFCIRISEQFNRDEIMQKMLDDGISTRAGIMNIHTEPAYNIKKRDYPLFKISGNDGLPKSEIASKHSIILPLYHQMEEVDQNRVVNALNKAIH